MLFPCVLGSYSSERWWSLSPLHVGGWQYVPGLVALMTAKRWLCYSMLMLAMSNSVMGPSHRPSAQQSK